MVGILGQLPRSAIAPRADELLERFSLSDAADRPLRTYSGGMRRRLDIAASLVPKPPVLFLDEPTTGLDLTSRNELWDMIRELVDEGTTVLLTTQYLEEADQLAGRIAVIDGGHVIANDTPERPQGRARRHRGRDGLRRRAGRRASDRAARRRRSRQGRARAPHGAGVVEPGRPRAGRRAASVRRATASSPTRCRCASRASTTCSSRSPATGPRRAEPTGDAA